MFGQLMNPLLRSRIARVFLLIGSLGPGLALTFDSATWGNSPTLLQLAALPIPLWCFGVLLIIASMMIVVPKWRDIGYAIVAIFYLIVNISAIFAITHGSGNSALIFALPVLLWIYLEASVTASRQQEGIQSASIPDSVVMGQIVKEE